MENTINITITNDELDKYADEVKELAAQVEELNAKAEAIKTKIKDEMTARGITKLDTGKYKFSYVDATQNRFDTTTFKQVHMDLYEKFLKSSSYKKFDLTKKKVKGVIAE